MGFSLAPEAIADGVWRPRERRGAAAWHALLPLRARLPPLAPGLVPPGPRLTPTPPLPTPFVLRHSRLGVGGPRKPASCHALYGLCNRLGFLRLGRGIGVSGLWG